jgi:PAS domain S-box-containing protein
MNGDGMVTLRELTDALTVRDSILKEKTRQLELSEEMFRTVFNLTPVPIAIIQVATGLILQVNIAFTALLGYCPNEIIGKHVLTLYYDPKDREMVLDEVGKKGSIKYAHVKLNHKDGTVIECLLSVKHITTDSVSLYLAIADNREHNQRYGDILV